MGKGGWWSKHIAEDQSVLGGPEVAGGSQSGGAEPFLPAPVTQEVGGGGCNLGLGSRLSVPS